MANWIGYAIVAVFTVSAWVYVLMNQDSAEPPEEHFYW